MPLAIREVDATDQAAVDVTFFYSGERADLADITVRENGELMEATPAVPFDDQQTLGVVLVIDASTSMEEGALIERVQGRRPPVRRLEGGHRSDRGRELRREGHRRPGVHHRQGRAQRGDRRHRHRVQHVVVRRHRAVVGALPRLRAPAEPRRLLRRRGHHLEGRPGDGRVGRHGRRRHPVRHRGREPRVRRPRLHRRGDRRHGHRRRRIPPASGPCSRASRRRCASSTCSPTRRRPTAARCRSSSPSGATPRTAEFVAGSSQGGAAALRPQTVAEPTGPAFFRSSAGLMLALAVRGHRGADRGLPHRELVLRR